MNTPSKLSFVADATLGKLVKYLRLAGFDTIMDTQKPDACRLSWMTDGHRTILTRSNRVRNAIENQSLLFIPHDQPLQQIRQVMDHLQLRRKDLSPLSRCTLCNQSIQKITKPKAKAQVPEYVWVHCTDFFICRKCRKIYWSGSHVERWLVFMDHWFV